LNLTYGSASFPFERMNLDTFYVQMPVNADSVSFADVQQAYESLFGNITAQYHAMAAENKQFIFCHLRPLENQLKNGSETWEMVSGVGEGPINLLTFGPNDYWIWWNQSPNQSGICDGPAYPGGYGSDAAEEIEIKVHLRKAMPCGYYSCINPVVIKAVAWDFPNSNQTSPNMYSSYLFDNLSYLPNFHFCLSPEEMNFYLNGAERIIYNPSPTGAKPEGLSFVSIDMQGDLLLLPDFISNPTHIAYITYATLITNPNPPLNL
ncbi:MAG: hypothetical protein HPY80_13345, partial [Bacteroidales bacterium]|nr:hypothetical protein [Bacteroidales bacterium]